MRRDVSSQGITNHKSCCRVDEMSFPGCSFDHFVFALNTERKGERKGSENDHNGSTPPNPSHLHRLSRENVCRLNVIIILAVWQSGARSTPFRHVRGTLVDPG